MLFLKDRFNKKKKGVSLGTRPCITSTEEDGRLRSHAQFCLYTFCRNIRLCDLDSHQGLIMITRSLQFFEQHFVPQKILGIVQR